MRSAEQWQKIIPDGGPVQQVMVATIIADLAEKEAECEDLKDDAVLTLHAHKAELAAMTEECNRLKIELEDGEAAAEAHIAELESEHKKDVEALADCCAAQAPTDIALEAAKARIVALRRFARHEPGCDITRTDMVNYRKAECTCGLDAALAGQGEQHSKLSVEVQEGYEPGDGAKEVPRE